MSNLRLPMAVCAAVGEVLASSGSHATLDALFAASGAPGSPPGLSHVSKWKTLLFQAGNDPTVDREQAGLCISNNSLAAVGRVGSHEPGYLYVTFQLLRPQHDEARVLTRAEISDICRRMRAQMGDDVEGLKRGLGTANDTAWAGAQKVTNYDVTPQ